MSLLYKSKEEQTTEVSIAITGKEIFFDFYSDCGKFGTDEPLAGYKLTPKRLLEILQEREDITDEEFN
jgi:hypothetical protein